MAKRVQLLGSYLSENASASVQGTVTTAAGYDPQSAVFLERATSWKAASAASGRLVLDLGTAKTPTGLGLVGGNFSAWGTTLIRHSTDSSTWVTLATLSGFPADTLDYFSVLTAAPSRQYWALEWSAPSAPQELAVFYLGTLTELPSNPLIGSAEAEDEDNVIEEKASSGAVMTDEYGRTVETLGLAWRLVVADFVTTRALFRVEGRKRPFFWIPRDDVGSGASGQAFFMRRAAPFAWEEFYTGAFRCGTKLREEA